MHKIHIKDLTIQVIIGILEHERITPQEIKIDLCLDCDLSTAASNDNIVDTINYAHVCKLVENICYETNFYLIEKLAQEITLRLLTSFHDLQAVDITIYKPHAIKNATVGIQIQQSR